MHIPFDEYFRWMHGWNRMNFYSIRISKLMLDELLTSNVLVSIVFLIHFTNAGLSQDQSKQWVPQQQFCVLHPRVGTNVANNERDGPWYSNDLGCMSEYLMTCQFDNWWRPAYREYVTVKRGGRIIVCYLFCCLYNIPKRLHVDCKSNRRNRTS